MAETFDWEPPLTESFEMPKRKRRKPKQRPRSTDAKVRAKVDAANAVPRLVKVRGKDILAPGVYALRVIAAFVTKRGWWPSLPEIRDCEVGDVCGSSRRLRALLETQSELGLVRWYDLGWTLTPAGWASAGMTPVQPRFSSNASIRRNALRKDYERMGRTRPCREHGCPERAYPGKRRCPRHLAKKREEHRAYLRKLADEKVAARKASLLTGASA